MKYLRACVIAFAMYSKIPMPKVEWEKESMEYAMCFFPLIGVVTGGCFFFVGRLRKLADDGEDPLCGRPDPAPCIDYWGDPYGWFFRYHGCVKLLAD